MACSVCKAGGCFCDSVNAIIKNEYDEYGNTYRRIFGY